MPNFINLPPFTDDGDVHVVVETPRGSRAKFAYDPKLETFILSKSLLTGLTYPHDWGFVPSTKADDGDPLDIMVIHDAATFPVQRLGHARPALCPVRALLIRVPLGPRPWLDRLRSRSTGFVRRLRSYSAGVLTSQDRASAATAPHLPATDHATQ